MLCWMSVHSSHPCIKLIFYLFETFPPKRSVQRLFYQIYVVKFLWRSWLWWCFMTWKMLLEYIFTITLFKEHLWNLDSGFCFWFGYWFYGASSTFSYNFTCSLFYAHFPLPPLPVPLFFYCFVLSVSFQLSFQNVEILQYHKLKFTSPTKNFCFLK